MARLVAAAVGAASEGVAAKPTVAATPEPIGTAMAVPAVRSARAVGAAHRVLIVSSPPRWLPQEPAL